MGPANKMLYQFYPHLLRTAITKLDLHRQCPSLITFTLGYVTDLPSVTDTGLVQTSMNK
ncbi:hypothetical protein Sjap_017709 [Stephania japonica]|uniref:Uncharacterized protein n=1 Tax=Stephania japonica TaxID=461633 RepID=A0AAP0I6N2_9MAGN